MTNPTQGPKKQEPFITKEGFIQFISTHKWDTIAYILLFIGLITSIFEEVTGGIIVGAVLGIYFSDEFKARFELFKEYIHKEGVFRAFIIVAGFLALLISSFGLCLGTVIGVFVRPLFGDAVSSPFDK